MARRFTSLRSSQKYWISYADALAGIKMKILAAHRAGLKTVILPRKNAADLEGLPDNVRGGLNFMVVDRIDEALDAAFAPSVEEQIMFVDSISNGRA